MVTSLQGSIGSPGFAGKTRVSPLKDVYPSPSKKRLKFVSGRGTVRVSAYMHNADRNKKNAIKKIPLKDFIFTILLFVLPPGYCAEY